MTNEPFFRVEGDGYIPTPACRGPWDPNSLHGRVVAGLLAFEIERKHGDPEFLPARLTVDLYRVSGNSHRKLKTVTTNADGRCDAPLLDGADFKTGQYELVFHAGDYLRRGGKRPEPLFLDVIPIRFGIADASQHYHVPLLLSPFGYSTYRGS